MMVGDAKTSMTVSHVAMQGICMLCIDRHNPAWHHGNLDSVSCVSLTLTISNDNRCQH